MILYRIENIEHSPSHLFPSCLRPLAMRLAFEDLEKVNQGIQQHEVATLAAKEEAARLERHSDEPSRIPRVLFR